MAFITGITKFSQLSIFSTIKKFDPLTNDYHLGIPNKEVKAGLMENLLPLYTSKRQMDNHSALQLSSINH